MDNVGAIVGMAWTMCAGAQMAGFPSENLICGQCGQGVLMLTMKKIYVILSSYTVCHKTHECSHPPWFGAQLKIVSTLSTLPPTKVLHRAFGARMAPAHGHMAMASEPPGHVDTAHIAPH